MNPARVIEGRSVRFDHINLHKKEIEQNKFTQLK